MSRSREMTEAEARRHFPKEAERDLVRQAEGEVRLREVLEGDHKMSRARADRVMGEVKEFADRAGTPVDTRDGEIVLKYAPTRFVMIEDE